jgi:hypothetical protein
MEVGHHAASVGTWGMDRMLRGGLAALAVMAVLAGAGSATAAPLKIDTQWHGPAMPLDVVNGGEFDNFVHLVPAADVSGQAWTMTPDSDGTFRLTTEFRGPKMCLDVVDTGPMDGFLKLTELLCALPDRA